MSINRPEQEGCDQKLVQLHVFRFADDLLEIGCFSGFRDRGPTAKAAPKNRRRCS